MQSFGRYTVSTHLPPAQPLSIITGPGYEYMRITNSSPYLLSINFLGMGTIDFPELFMEDILLTDSYMGTITITPFINLSNVAHTPSDLLTISTYSKGELPHPQSQSMALLANVGNDITIVAGQAQTVQDDLDAAGVVFVEATPTGDPGSAVVIKNDGTLILGNSVHKGSISSDNGLVTTDGLGGLSASNLIVSTNLHTTSIQNVGTTEGIVAVTGTAGTMNTRLQSQGIISFQVPAGTGIATIDGTGINIVKASTQGFGWFNGNFIPELSFFSGAASGTYNHGFNGTGESLTPFHIIPMCNTLNGSQTMGYDSVTSTQVHITSGAGLSFKAMCV